MNPVMIRVQGRCAIGVLDKLESPTQGGTLFTFQRTHVTGNRGWERRNATFTIANTPFGSSPFLSTGAPFAPHRWKWSARFFTSRTHMSNDAVIDALYRAMDLGRPVRLVYLHDDGYERICDAIGYLADAPVDSLTDGISVDLAIEWEILAPWRERAGVNADRHSGAGYRSGQILSGSVIRSGSSSAVAVSSTTFTVPSTMCDSTVAGSGGVPTYSDTTAVMRLTGPIGGDSGFTIANSAGQGSRVTVALKLIAGDLLIMDYGAKDYLLTRGGVTTDVSPFVTSDRSFGYDFAIVAGVLNPITITANGPNPTSGGSFVAQWQRLFS